MTPKSCSAQSFEFPDSLHEKDTRKDGGKLDALGWREVPRGAATRDNTSPAVATWNHSCRTGEVGARHENPMAWKFGASL